MNIAVITFSDFNTNYGSMLQAFSLMQYLEFLGHNVIFIKYREYNKPQFLSLKQRTVFYSKKMLLQIYRLLKSNDLYKTQKNFEEFRTRYFKHTPLYTSSKEIIENMCEFPCYICGSDQIWNLNCLGGLKTPYFLDFAPKHALKFSYAASLGEYCFTDDIKQVVSQLLDNLNYISIREAEKVNEVQALTKIKVVSTVDPVFLNKSGDWNKWIPDCPIEGEYAVCYFVRRSNFGKRIIQIIADKYKIPIYNLSDNMIYIPKTSSRYISVGPLEFLSLLKNAKYAVGTSFHLVAFSVIFDIPILAIGLESNRSRIQNILKKVGLENHFITEDSDYMNIINSFMDDRMDTELLDLDIQYSKDFIASILNKGI